MLRRRVEGGCWVLGGRMKRQLTIVHIILAVLLSTGCSSVKDEQLLDGDLRWGAYSRNKIFEIRTDVFLLQLSEPYGNEPVKFSLTPEASYRERSSVYGAPDSIRKYLEHGEVGVSPSTGSRYHGTSTVKGVAVAGTKFVVVDAIEYHFWNWFLGSASRVVVYADILDGDFKRFRVDIQDLSSHKCCDSQGARARTILHPDEGLLKEILISAEPQEPVVDGQPTYLPPTTGTPVTNTGTPTNPPQ